VGRGAGNRVGLGRQRLCPFLIVYFGQASGRALVMKARAKCITD